MDLTKYNIIGLNERNQICMSMGIVVIRIKTETKRAKYFTYHLGRCVKDIDKTKLTLLVIAHASQLSGLIGMLVKLRNDLIKTFPQPRKPMLLLPQNTV